MVRSRLCAGKILQHAHNISYSLCCETYHLKCVYIVPKDIKYIESYRGDWYCSYCLINVFPFDNLENEIDFMSAINDSPASGSLGYLSDKMFLPFELNVPAHQYGNDDIDPDLNYFRSFKKYISCCNYFIESSFNSEISKSLNMKQYFCICQSNFRSLRKLFSALWSFVV